VVCGRVESVCPDRIGTEGLEEGDVAAAVGRVGQGVEELGAARRSTSSGRLLLVRDALDEELRAILVEEFGALEAGLAEGAAICGGASTDLHDDGREGGGGPLSQEKQQRPEDGEQNSE